MRKTWLPAVLISGLLATSLVGADTLELSDVEARGKQIYLRGSSQGGMPIDAFLGVDRIKLPASAAPCGSCHGIDGRGRPEGGVVPPNITWRELSKSYGHEHDYGRRHPAFDEASLAATILGGADPAGNKLDVVMPRYRMAKDDIDALIAYLKRIELDFGPGVSEHAVTVGTLLPLSGPAGPQGAAVQAILEAFLTGVNAGGGVNGRAIELEVLSLGATAAETAKNVRPALQSSRMLALLAPYVPGADTDLVALLADSEIPIIGPVTPTPDAARNRLASAYYLYAGSSELLQSLGQFALRGDTDQPVRQLVVGPESALLRELARKLPITDKRSTETLPYARGGFQAANIAALLHDMDEVYFTGSRAELDELITALALVNTFPRVFLPASVATPALLQASAEFDGRIFVAYPTLPGDVTDTGRNAFAQLAEYGDLPPSFYPSQVAALAAAKLLLEALQRAGHVLNRERLTAELERMNDYSTGLMPPVSFDLNRRIGARGAHIVRVDVTAGRLVPVGEWSKLQ